jgi:hypothetical protein
MSLLFVIGDTVGERCFSGMLAHEEGRVLKSLIDRDHKKNQEGTWYVYNGKKTFCSSFACSEYRLFRRQCCGLFTASIR